MSVTINDIAELSGVSTATVSRVINSPEKVSKKTRQKVLKIINKHQYQPNKIAQNLSSNTSDSLAIFVYDITNPFFTKLIRELNQIAFDKGYSLLICDTDGKKDREQKYIDYINQNKFAGLILTEGITQGYINQIDESCPLVCVDRDIKYYSNYFRISSENRNGAHKAIKHLINLNHKKIAFISGPPDIKTAEERKLGYLDMVSKYKLPVDDKYIFTGDLKKETGLKALEYFLTLNEPPTAIFCSNDLIAEGVMDRALSLNLEIPKDISLIGFDGVYNNFYKKLTTIKQNIPVIAEKTIENLLKIITGDEVKKEIINIPVELKMGETCQNLKIK